MIVYEANGGENVTCILDSLIVGIIANVRIMPNDKTIFTVLWSRPITVQQSMIDSVK